MRKQEKNRNHFFPLQADSKPPLPLKATKSRSRVDTDSPLALPRRSSKSHSNSKSDRPCPLSRDSLLYLRRRSNALICSFTSGYPENYSGSSCGAVNSAGGVELRSSCGEGSCGNGGVHSKRLFRSSTQDAVGSYSSFDAAPSSSSSYGVGIINDSGANTISTDATDGAFIASDGKLITPRFPLNAERPSGVALRSSSSSTSFVPGESVDVASPRRHVCAAFSGAGSSAAPFGADFCCVVCGKKAPKAENGCPNGAITSTGAEEKFAEKRQRRESRRKFEAATTNEEDAKKDQIFLQQLKGLRKLRSNW